MTVHTSKTAAKEVWWANASTLSVHCTSLLQNPSFTPIHSSLGLFDRASSSWNEVKCQLDVYGLDGAVRRHGTIQTVHTTYAAALKTTTHLQTGYRKPYAATTSSGPDDGRMRPKHVDLRKLQ
jgi:hypothetical protein